MRSFVQAEANARGHAIGTAAVEQIVDALGDDLFAISDALERLSLYVGAKKNIGPDHVNQCVEPTRTETIWTLVDSIARKEAKSAMHALRSLLADREPPLRILAMIARQLRILARARSSLARGASPMQAAKDAGAPPFKADELARSAGMHNETSLASSLLAIAECDQRLKGSINKPESVIEEYVLKLCSA